MGVGTSGIQHGLSAAIDVPASAPPGFRRTEVGVIPEDWAVSMLGASAFVTKLAGFEYTRHFDYSLTGPVIAVRGLNIQDGVLDLRDVHTIPKRTSDALPRSKLRQGDLVISYVGTLGRVAVVPEDDRFHLAPNVAKISVAIDAFDPGFLSQYLNSFHGQKAIFEAAASTSQAALSMANLRTILVVRPPLAEQRAIATVLSDVDELIGALDRLISKTRSVKRATMQQLLTGQTRLPGFTGDWAPTAMGHIATTYGGLSGKTKSDFGRGTARYVPFLNVLENAVVDCGKLDRVRVASGESQNLVREGDLLFNGTSETPGDLAMGSVLKTAIPSLYLNSFCFGFRLRDRDEHDALFLAYFFRGPVGRRIMYALSQGATRYNMSKKQFLALGLSLPRGLEQRAIATVLSDMDAEIAALERRRVKTQAIKQGMMQALLTGRVRLIEGDKA